MFTGLIQAIGRIHNFSLQGKKAVLEIDTPFSPTSLKIGESIAINGCCLTLVQKKKKRLSFDIADETLRKTALSCYKKGMRVNLERCLRPIDRMGGHFVLGHVDGVGKIGALKRTEGSLEICVSYPKHLSPYLVDKGSIALDGISLTVSLKKSNLFSVYIIPHTEKMTNLFERKKGDLLNLEMDILGKYVTRLISSQ